MPDQFFAAVLFVLALLTGCITVVMFFASFLDWLHSGDWGSISVLRAGYEAHLLKARWFLQADWGWRLHEVLERIPLLAVSAALAPIFWGASKFLARR